MHKLRSADVCNYVTCRK